jgi:integrase
MANIQKRTTANGETTYRVQVRLKGFPPQTASFARLTDARKWASATETAIREGRHFKTVEAKRHSFNEMADRYIRDVLPHKGSDARQQRVQRNQLLWWKERLGHYTLVDITPAKIAEIRDGLLATPLSTGGKRAPATANRYLAILSHAYTIAMKEWGWVEENPLRKVRRPTEPRGRVRFLSDEEREALLEACRESNSKALYMVVVLALSTGARHGELMNLRWQDVDFNRNVLTLHETKNGERRLLPLAGHALELIKAHGKVRRLDTDFIFPNSRGDKPVDVRKSFEAALEKASIDDFRFHDLRHSAASYLAMNGATLAEIAEVLGHKTLAMVKRYAHLSEAHTSKVVAAMNERIFG